MEQEVIPTRSKNNNVFRFSSYFHRWSRVLFHDAGGRGMLRMRQLYNIPQGVDTIEIDLEPHLENGWSTEKIDQVVFRRHCTSLDGSDKFVGTLPKEVVERMYQNLPKETVELLLHADYLPGMDLRKKGNTFIELAKDMPTHEEFFHRYAPYGGPGVFLEDTVEDWKRLVTHLEKKIQTLTPLQSRN